MTNQQACIAELKESVECRCRPDLDDIDSANILALIEQLQARVAELTAEVEEQRSDHLKLVEENHELRQQRDLAVEALIGIENFAVQPWAGMATEALSTIKESEKPNG